MKFLYIAAEHVSGTLSLFQDEHRRRGDECRFVTFWHSRWNFPDDICLNLSLMPTSNWLIRLRKLLTSDVDCSDKSTATLPPFWKPNPLARALFSLRDELNWPKISRAISEHKLDDFDIIHLDGGLDFTRDARFTRSLARQGKHIAAFYHGTDLRQRGVLPSVDELTELRLTSEWDLLELDPRLEYLYLPFDTSAYPVRQFEFHRPVRICHAKRNDFKGTERIVAAIEKLRSKYELEFDLIAYESHDEAIARMSRADIFVDQLTNSGGWGYGMSSVEALSLGLAVVTNIPARMSSRLSANPFIQADESAIEGVLEYCISDESMCRKHSIAGQQWVREHHDVRSVGDVLYHHYNQLGWLT